MSRRAVPLLVAGVTGILSGIYIFKPLFDPSYQNKGPHSVGGDVPPAGPPAERSATTTEGQGNASADKQHAPVTPGSGAQDIKQ